MTPAGTPSMTDPPADLSVESADWFRRIVREYGIADESGLLILAQGMRAYDRSNEARGILKKEGLTVTDRYGQTRPHPAASVETASTRNFLACMKALNLELEPVRPGPGRPPGRR
jgi:hypothetical protein